MRVIKPSTLRAYAARHADAEPALMRWLDIAEAAEWLRWVDVRATFGKLADTAIVASGRTVTIFDICGTKYRLITAIHYNMRKVFILRFLTHAQYNKDQWKDQL